MSVTLDAPAAQVTAAAGFLAEWYARQTDVVAHRSYVAAGHDCIAAIDGALRALHHARAALVAEIHRDAIERDIRVDELLARIAAERAEREAGYSREDPVTNGPLPDGVEGRPLGRHANGRGGAEGPKQ
jgi:hypothetical protein